MKFRLMGLKNQKGIRLSIGHSDATYDDLKDILGESIHCATHLFNAMSPIKGREPGVVGASFIR